MDMKKAKLLELVKYWADQKDDAGFMERHEAALSLDPTLRDMFARMIESRHVLQNYCRARLEKK